jgi:plastocyanin
MDKHAHGTSRHPSRRRGLAAAAVLALLAIPLIRAGEAGGNAAPTAMRPGRLAGSVSVGPELSSRKLRFNLYPDLVQPAVAAGRPSRQEELKNVVIYLEPAPPGVAARSPAASHPVMKQEGLTFVPHVLPVLKGATVEFPNEDPIFHNVFSLSKASSFDLGRYPRGASKSVRFDEPGIVKVFCHIHSDMSAVIIVLDNPFFTAPDTEGRFQIDGIPSGDYRAVGWHERSRPQVLKVRIEPGQASVLNFRIPLTEPSGGG